MSSGEAIPLGVLNELVHWGFAFKPSQQREASRIRRKSPKIKHGNAAKITEKFREHG